MRYREQQPTFIPPMLLSSGTVPSGDAWTFELKWDGCRAQLRYDGRSVSLRTRNARGAMIYEGTSEIHQLMQAGYALGYREDGALRCELPAYDEAAWRG